MPGYYGMSALNHNGTDCFTYKLGNSQVDSSLASVSLSITPVSDARLLRMPALLWLGTGPDTAH